eukprot:2214578-Prymnesium_polylepis.2
MSHERPLPCTRMQARENWLALARQVDGPLPFSDAVEGSNKHFRKGCSKGFDAAVGWDPVRQPGPNLQKHAQSNQKHSQVNGLGSVSADSLSTIMDFCDNITCDAIGAAPAPLDAREALSALYASAGGADWTENSGWLSADDVCTWKGIGCNGGIVTRVELTGNSLKASHPFAACRAQGVDVARPAPELAFWHHSVASGGTRGAGVARLERQRAQQHRPVAVGSARGADFAARLRSFSDGVRALSGRLAHGT